MQRVQKAQGRMISAAEVEAAILPPILMAARGEASARLALLGIFDGVPGIGILPKTLLERERGGVR